jgi:myo-inositol 2-dehydrogenase/D-chiro-inositol 1-dehydrogenase
MIDAGALGRIEYIRDTMRDPQPQSREYTATSGGLFRDMAVHNFDSTRWLMGSEVEEVYALGVSLVDPMFAELGDVDTSVVTLRFANGSIASVDNSRRASFGYDVRTEVHGSVGAVFVGYARETPLLHLSAEGVRGDHVHWFLERFEQAYVAELGAFVESIAGGRPPEVDGYDGRAAMAIAFAADVSRRENRPVSLRAFDRKPAG